MFKCSIGCSKIKLRFYWTTEVIKNSRKRGERMTALKIHFFGTPCGNICKIYSMKSNHLLIQQSLNWSKSYPKKNHSSNIIALSSGNRTGTYKLLWLLSLFAISVCTRHDRIPNSYVRELASDTLFVDGQ